MLGRGKAPHNAVRDALMHLVVQCGMADAAVVETPVTSADGFSTVADVVFMRPLLGRRPYRGVQCERSPKLVRPK